MLIRPDDIVLGDTAPSRSGTIHQKFDVSTFVRSFIAGFYFFCAIIGMTTLVITCIELSARAFVPERILNSYMVIRDYRTSDPFSAQSTQVITDTFPIGTVESISGDVISKKVRDEYSSLAGGGLELFPYTGLQGPSHFRSTVINTNSQGFRCSDFDALTADRRPVIVLLGGSGMWGAGATSDTTTIGGQLQKILDESGRNFRVVNLAQPGFNSTQELITYVRYGLPLGATHIVIMDGGNDISHAFWQGVPGNPAYFREMTGIIRMANIPAAKKLANSLRSVMTANYFLGVSAIDPVAGIEDRTATPVVTKFERLDEAIKENYRFAIENLLILAKAHGAKVILGLQPTTGRVEPRSQLEKRLGNGERFLLIYDQLDRAQKQLAAKYAVDRFNGSEVFNERRNNDTAVLIVDPFHYTDHGNELLAKKIGQFILAEDDRRL